MRALGAAGLAGDGEGLRIVIPQEAGVTETSLPSAIVATVVMTLSGLGPLPRAGHCI